MCRSVPTGKGMCAYFIDRGTAALYSYLRVDAGSRVQEVREKNAISDLANVGAYGFPSAGALRSHIASVLDALEPEANCSMHPSTLRKLGAVAGDLISLTTRRGSVNVMVREDRAVSPDQVFLPFAYVEAAANILTNSALDPYGKIPEFKFSAVRVEKASVEAPA